MLLYTWETKIPEGTQYSRQLLEDSIQGDKLFHHRIFQTFGAIWDIRERSTYYAILQGGTSMNTQATLTLSTTVLCNTQTKSVQTSSKNIKNVFG